MTGPTQQIRDYATLRVNRRILIIADDVDGSVGMVEHLRKQQLGVVITAFDGETLHDLPQDAPSAVLCFLTDYIEKAAFIVEAVRKQYPHRDFPILGRLERKDEFANHPFDSVLYAPVHPVQVAQRMISLVRLRQMEAEIVRRIETLQDTFGETPALPSAINHDPFKVLFIGKADPAYMAVVNALQDRNADVIAAFTSFSALDYLHDQSFDAVVMNALSGNEPAMTISETMRRNPRLTHVPTLLLIDANSFTDEDMAYRHGVNDLIDQNAPSDEISGRILELANSYRLQEKLKSDFSSFLSPSSTDLQTGVFNKRFFEAHLRRVSRECRERLLPLCVLTVRMRPKPDGPIADDVLNIALSKCVRLIAGVLRMHDIVARLDRDVVCIAFAEERRDDVELIADRIRELISNAVFDTPNDTYGALTLTLDTQIVEQELPIDAMSRLSGYPASRPRLSDRPRPLPMPHLQSEPSQHAQHPEPSP